MKAHPNLLVVDWLIHSYLYYIKDTSVILDSEFDIICQRVRDEWDRIDHPHKRLIDRDASGDGKSGFYLKEADYPSITKSVAMAVLSGKIQHRRYL